MAACDGFIHGGGTGQGNHDFGGGLPFSRQLTVQRLVRVAVEPQVPVEAVLGCQDLHHKGLDHRLRHILPLVEVRVPFQGILQDGELLGVNSELLEFSTVEWTKFIDNDAELAGDFYIIVNWWSCFVGE